MSQSSHRELLYPEIDPNPTTLTQLGGQRDDPADLIGQNQPHCGGQRFLFPTLAQSRSTSMTEYLILGVSEFADPSHILEVENPIQGPSPGSRPQALDPTSTRPETLRIGRPEKHCAVTELEDTRNKRLATGEFFPQKCTTARSTLNA